MLRFNESRAIVDQAKEFYYTTEKEKPGNFLDFASIAEQIYKVKIIIRN